MPDGPVFAIPEYLRRQSALLSQLDIHSILLIPTNDMKIRSHDVHFPFRASSDILYLTGWEEPKHFLWPITMVKSGRPHYLSVTITNWQKGGKEKGSGYPELRRDGLWTTLEIGRAALMFRRMDTDKKHCLHTTRS